MDGIELLWACSLPLFLLPLISLLPSDGHYCFYCLGILSKANGTFMVTFDTWQWDKERQWHLYIYEKCIVMSDVWWAKLYCFLPSDHQFCLICFAKRWYGVWSQSLKSLFVIQLLQFLFVSKFKHMWNIVRLYIKFWTWWRRTGKRIIWDILEINTQDAKLFHSLLSWL